LTKFVPRPKKGDLTGFPQKKRKLAKGGKNVNGTRACPGLPTDGQPTKKGFE